MNVGSNVKFILVLAIEPEFPNNLGVHRAKPKY